MRYRALRLASLALAAGAVLAAGCTEHTIYAPSVATPVAVALAETVDLDGDPVSLPYAKAPFGTTVTLDGRESFDPDHTDFSYDFLDYAWEFELTPAGSEAELTFPNTLPDSVDEDPARPTFDADVAGAYRIQLKVTNADTEVTSAADYVTVQATPWEDLSIDMYWTTPATDVDLHLIGPGGEYYGEGDCYFGNPNPDWGVDGAAVDDPLYTADDDNGGDDANPAHEAVEIDSPGEGVYQVVVTYHSDRHSGQTVQPWVEATIAGVELYARLDAPEAMNELDAWVVMEIEIPELTVTVIDELTTHEDLGGPPVND